MCFVPCLAMGERSTKAEAYARADALVAAPPVGVARPLLQGHRGAEDQRDSPLRLLVRLAKKLKYLRASCARARAACRRSTATCPGPPPCVQVIGYRARHWGLAMRGSWERGCLAAQRLRWPSRDEPCLGLRPVGERGTCATARVLPGLAVCLNLVLLRKRPGLGTRRAPASALASRGARGHIGIAALRLAGMLGARAGWPGDHPSRFQSSVRGSFAPKDTLPRIWTGAGAGLRRQDAASPAAIRAPALP